MANCIAIIAITIFHFLLQVGLLEAHGGGIDAFGCHNDRKHGGYHCHHGPLAGQAFASQSQMLQQLKQSQPATGASNLGSSPTQLTPADRTAEQICIRENQTKRIMCGEIVR